MAKREKQNIAVELRLQGKSYNQIKQKLEVSKGTLSRWLHHYPLTQDRIRELRSSDGRIERFRETMKRKRDMRLRQYYQEEKKKWIPLSAKEFFIAGLFLYWGEGAKSGYHTLGIYNTDPALVKFGLQWFLICLSIPISKVRVSLHLYRDMDVQAEIGFWSKYLSINKQAFLKPYIKKSERKRLNHKGFGHGTCGVIVHDVKTKEKILMALKAFADYYGHQGPLIS